MDAIRGFLVVVFGMAIGVAGTIFVMIKGWGLEPKSWWWIIVVNLLMQSIAILIIQIGAPKKGE